MIKNSGLPINGEKVCAALKSIASDSAIWRVRAIETLTDSLSTILGDLWRSVQNQNVLISTKELCEHLKLAHQIITLDVVLESDDSVALLIEDGEVVNDPLNS